MSWGDIKSIAAIINEDASFWIRTYGKARAENEVETAQYEQQLTNYTIRLLCDHRGANWIGHNSVYCRDCKAQVIVANYGR